MTTAPLPDPPDPDDAHYYRRVLHAVIDLGVEVARELHAHITADHAAPDDVDDDSDAATPDADAPRPTLPQLVQAFDVATRSVRRGVRLAQFVAQSAATAAAQAAPAPAPPDLPAARRHIARKVEDAIQEFIPVPEADDLRAELLERLDGTDIDDDLRRRRPVSEIVTELCRDLGAVPTYTRGNFRRRTPDDIADLWAIAARPAPDPIKPALRGQPATVTPLLRYKPPPGD